VTAHNNAGFAVAEFEFATLTITGGRKINFFLSFQLCRAKLLKYCNQIFYGGGRIMTKRVAFIFGAGSCAGPV